MSKTLTLFMLAGALALSACNAQERTTPPSDSLEDQAAFILGHDIGSNIHHQIEDLGFTEDAVMAGFRAGLRGDSLDMSQQEVDSIMVAFQTRVMDRMVQTNRADGQAFLTEFDQQADVVTTESGLRYRVLEEGEGGNPSPDDVVTLHYEGRLPDGKVFDSSHRRGQPATFPVQGVVPGFSEALQLMQAGGKYEIVLPPELGYGDQAPPAIGPGQTLIFTVDLLEIGQSQ